jgi:DNA adenine methylase
VDIDDKYLVPCDRIPKKTSLIKWAGGKSRLAKKIDKYREGRNLVFVPFAGGLGYGLYALKDPRVQLFLADLEDDVVNFWRHIQKSPLETYALFNQFPRESGWQDEYNDIRAAFNERTKFPAKSRSRAACFWWLNRACYNGLWRKNKAGGFNTPRGSYARIVAPHLSIIMKTSWLLQRAHIAPSGQDYGTTLAWAQRTALQANRRTRLHQKEQPEYQAFVYADPPYSGAFSKYTSKGFEDRHHKHLSAALSHLHRIGINVAISNSGQGIKFYPGWQHEVVEARRTISRDGSKRGLAQEILAYKTHGDARA